MSSRWTLPALCALLLLLCRGAAAAAPRLDLKLERVTLLEALRAVTRQVGAEFLLEGKPLAEVKPEAEAPRASFTWKQTPLGVACHEVAKAFGVTVNHSDSATADFRKEAQPEKTPFRVTVPGCTFLVTELEKRARGEGDPESPEAGFAGTLWLVARPDHHDPDLLFALNRTRITTDLGPARAIPPGMPLYASRGLDDMTLWVPLDRIPPGARKLTLESRLVSYRGTRSEHGELPLVLPPAPGEAVKKAALEPVTPTTTATEKTVGPVRMRIRNFSHALGEGTRLEIDATWPGDVKISVDTLSGSRFSDWPVPVIKRRSGQFIYFNVDGQDLTPAPPAKPKTGKEKDEEDEDDAETGPQPEHHVRLWCATDGWDVGDPPVALMWDLAVHTGPAVRIPFKIADIPIPPGPVEETPASDRNSSGGELASPVVLAGLPPGERELVLGLSRQEGADWGPVRWRTVSIGRDGVARLDGIPAGNYRVLRALLIGREVPASMEDAPLRRVSTDWENASVTVRVEAGKLATLPPLRPKP